MVDRFLELHLEETSNPADLGLLLLLLAEGGRDEQLLRDVVGRISSTLEHKPTSAFTIQELGWMLWGSSVAARLGASRAEELAHRVFALMDERFVDPMSLLARHNLSRHRGRVVSFGGTVYFLRSVYEYGSLSGDCASGPTIRERRQGDAEAAGASRGVALDDLGADGGSRSTSTPSSACTRTAWRCCSCCRRSTTAWSTWRARSARSVAWSLGDNELGEPMYGRDPGSSPTARSERDQVLFRQRHVFARSLARAVVDHPGSLTGSRARGRQPGSAGSCHHLGWILYTWAGRSDQPGLEASLKPRLRAGHPGARRSREPEAARGMPGRTDHPAAGLAGRRRRLGPTARPSWHMGSPTRASPWLRVLSSRGGADKERVHFEDGRQAGRDIVAFRNRWSTRSRSRPDSS